MQSHYIEDSLPPQKCMPTLLGLPSPAARRVDSAGTKELRPGGAERSDVHFVGSTSELRAPPSGSVDAVDELSPAVYECMFMYIYVCI
jgi:hypothetical protein